MTSIASISLLAVLLTALLIGCIWAYFTEKKDFNHGICPVCGTPLRHFDDDSQGAQGWCCDKCGYTTWISWFQS